MLLSFLYLYVFLGWILYTDVYFPSFNYTAYEYIFFFFLQVHDVSFSSVSLVSRIDFPNSLSQRSKPLSERTKWSFCSPWREKGRASSGGDASGFQRSPWDSLLTHRTAPVPGRFVGTQTTILTVPRPLAGGHSVPSAQAKLELQFATLHRSFCRHEHIPCLHLASLARWVALITSDFIQSTTFTQGLCSF